MLLSPTQLFSCLHAHACAAAALQLLRSHAPQPYAAIFLLARARVCRRRTAAPALACSSARRSYFLACTRTRVPPPHCSSCARMLLSPPQLFSCLHAHACAAAALQLLRSHAPQPA